MLEKEKVNLTKKVDVETLQNLANIYNVPLIYLMEEHQEELKPIKLSQNQIPHDRDTCCVSFSGFQNVLHL